jgi:signal transduction histidine kinase
VESPHYRTTYTQRRKLIVGVTVLLYALIFVPLYQLTGVIAASLSVAPIVLAGWLFGKRGGLLASLVSIPIHVALFTLAGATGWLVVLQQWPGSVMGVVVGLGAGWLGDFSRRVQRQSQDLLRERAALRAEIARRERVEYELQQAKLVAEAANRAKSTFLANVSHELRTPLTAIIGYSDLLGLYASQNDIRRFRTDVKKIHTAGHQLLSLINDVLDLSKIEAGKMELNPEAFELPPLIHEVADTIQPLLTHNGNRLDVQHVDTQDAVVCMDRAKLRQVLLNLLNNAAKFTQGGVVRLEIASEAQYTIGDIARTTGPGSDPAAWHVFRISDTGIGMSEEQIQNIFQPFTQADTRISRTYGGTWLGLALCQRFCQLMGGSIGVTSAPGVGTTFVVRLPNTAANYQHPVAD